MKILHANGLPFIGMLLLVFLGPLSFGQTAVPESRLVKLQADSEKAQHERAGTIAQRRAFKRVVRTGMTLLSAYPEAENRFHVLGIALDNQKMVVHLEPTDRNRQLLYEISAQLVSAPDTWATSRLEADLLLMERDLTAKNASITERADALKALIERYRDTEAEEKSLIITATIAQSLKSNELLKYIEAIMNERFANVPEVIAFRRQKLNLKSLIVKCEGRYKRSDGTMLNIPGDRIGHQLLLVYWSQEHPVSKRFLQQVEEQRKTYDGKIEVYSINLDQLPDAGQSLLRDMGLGWDALHLPDGKQNIYYQAYAEQDPTVLFVNAYGYTVLTPFGANSDMHVGMRGEGGRTFKVSESRLSHPRFLAQLQALFIGDFLITDTASDFDPDTPPELKMVKDQQAIVALTQTPDSVPAKTLEAIQACFVLPPFRYRLSMLEAKERYRSANELCEKTLSDFPKAPNLWVVRNRRIIALLGLWNLELNPAHLEQATKEANTVLASDAPPAAMVVAHFCRAKAELRKLGSKPQQLIRQLIDDLGGESAPVSAFAAAAMLSLEANERSAHEHYREQVLTAPAPPALQGMRAFLLNHYHRFFLLRPNTTRGDRLRGSRGYIVNHGSEPTTTLFPPITLKLLDGSDLKLPKKNNSKMTLLLFIEPPPASEADFPRFKDRNGKPTDDDYIRRVVKDAMWMRDEHVNKNVEVIIAFISDDANRIADLAKKNEWTGTFAMVPDGLKNPMITQLDILSADKVPNVFLLRRDGTIAWQTFGYRYKSEFGFPFAYLLAMKVHIEQCEVVHGLRQLKKQEYEQAAKTFAGPFKPVDPDRYGWRSPRHHGRAVALIGSEKWKEALDAVEVAIDAHKRRHYRYEGRRGPKAKDWRPGMAKIQIDPKDACTVFQELWTLKAMALEKLDRNEEAKTFRQKAALPVTEDNADIYRSAHDHFRSIRQGWEAKE